MSKSKKVDVCVELSKMKRVKVKLDQIYLDPNNPRLEISNRERTPDERALEPGVQEHCLNRMCTEIKVADLMDSIKTCGFATMDRIVVKSVQEKKYIVLEGNRRVTALKILEQGYREGSISLKANILKSIKEFEALLYEGENEDIAWVIQGLRHAAGIKKWGDYPKAKFITKIHEAGTHPREIASRFGMKPQAEVSRLIRSYYAFEQAREDEDFGEDLKPEKFGMFTEVVFAKPQIKEWLGWKEEKKQFEDVDNLAQFVSWIVPCEGRKSKIDISTTTRDTLAKLVEPDYGELFDEFKDGKVSIEECKEKIYNEEEEISVDLSKNMRSLEKMKSLLEKLPIAKMQLAKEQQEKDQKKQIIKLLTDLSQLVTQQLKNLRKG